MTDIEEIPEHEFLLSLPEDPLEAFYIYESRLRRIYLNQNNWNDEYGSYDSRTQYISKIIGYLQAHELDFGISDEIPDEMRDFNAYFSHAERKITILVERLKIQSIQKQKRNLIPIYIIEASTKLEIHHHIKQIRTLIEASNIVERKKDRLFDRLNALSLEVDKGKSKGDIAMSLYTMIKSDAAKGADNINEMLSHAKGIVDAYAKSQEAPLVEINFIKKVAIEPPKKRIEGPKIDEMEDDIPF